MKIDGVEVAISDSGVAWPVGGYSVYEIGCPCGATASAVSASQHHADRAFTQHGWRIDPIACPRCVARDDFDEQVAPYR